MGDKSQLLAMTFATKYKLKIVIPGVFLGILLNHGIAVLVGNYISRFIPINYLSFLAAFVFILFGWMSLRIEEEESGEDQSLKNRGPILTIAITFFLGEFGDKTQITAMTLASEAANPFIILFGTVSAMMMTSILGIFVGMKIGKKVPEKNDKNGIFFYICFLRIDKIIFFNGNEYCLCDSIADSTCGRDYIIDSFSENAERQRSDTKYSGAFIPAEQTAFKYD